MTSPSTKTFAVSGPVDMYFKLVWEYAQLRNFSGEEERRVASYRAMNAATTALHMWDWIKNRLTPAHYDRLQQSGIAVTSEQELRAYAMNFPAFFLCESIANAAKHSVIRARPRDVTTSEARLGACLDKREVWVPMAEDGESSMPVYMAIGQTIEIWGEVLLASGLATEQDLAKPRPL